MKFNKFLTALTIIVALIRLNSAQAEGRLTVYCTMQHETCEKITQEFTNKYDVQTQFVANGSGATFSKLKLEKNNPQADVWYGGTIDYHLQARELNLFERYRSPLLAETLPQLHSLAETYGDTTGFVSLMVLGIGVNTDKLKKLGISELPQCWDDLLDPRLKGEVQIPDPQVSGTSYTFIANLIQLRGEEQAFAYLHKLHAGIPRYATSTLVGNNLERGDIAVAMGFVHDYAKAKQRNAAVEYVLPCDGHSYSLDGVSIIKNARNLHNAKLFMDFVLSKEAQEIPWREVGVYQTPINVNSEISPLSEDPKKLKLIDFDFKRFGSKDEGKRIIDKWVTEVKNGE